MIVIKEYVKEVTVNPDTAVSFNFDNWTPPNNHHLLTVFIRSSTINTITEFSGVVNGEFKVRNFSSSTITTKIYGNAIYLKVIS